MTKDLDDDKQRRPAAGRGLTRPLLVTSLVAAAGAAAIAPTAAGATDAGPDDSGTQESVWRTGISQVPPEVVARIQAPLLAETDRIRALVRENKLEGFAGLRVSLEASRVTLYWKGERPADLTALLAGSEVPVDVVEAPYTREELRAERARILADPTNVLGVTEITGIGIPPEGDRLTVTVAPSERAARRLTTDTGVPVVWATGESDFAATRYDDSPPPVDGGARIVSGGSCTTGFGMTSLWDGASRMMSAAHCGDPWDQWTTGAGAPVGQTVTQHNSADVNLISVASGSKIWDGAVSSSGQPVNAFQRGITGWTAATVGSKVWSSGSFSGGTSGIEIMNDDEVVCGFPEGVGGWDGCTTNQVEGEQVNHTAAWGKGDSGGPVFYLDGGNARAAGIISSIQYDGDTTCVGVPNSARTGPVECSWHVHFTDIEAAMYLLVTDINTV